jgi:hypothetical protein
LAIEGKADQLNPYYYYLNQFFRATIDPKIGDATALRYYAPNLINRMALDEEGFCIFDFIWNELRAMNDPMKLGTCRVVPDSSIFTATKPDGMTYSYRKLSANKLKPFGSLKKEKVIQPNG